jgi:DNA-binding transcriptional LysR family regulator
LNDKANWVHNKIWQPDDQDWLFMIRNIAQLEAFYWVARLNSFHSAAKRLGLTQPAVSSRVKDLERSLGVPLLERTTRSVTCTPQGRAIFDYVERLLTMLQELEGRARGQSSLKGLLRFGAPDSFGTVCLSKFMTIMDRHTDLNIEVTIDNSRNLSEKLEAGSLDIALISQPNSIKHLNVVTLGAHESAWMASPSLKLHTRELTTADIAAQTILSNPSPSNTFSLLMDWFGGSTDYPHRIHTCTSLHMIVELVANGVGVAVLPSCLLSEPTGRGRLVRLKVQNELPLQEMIFGFSKGAGATASLEVLQTVRTVIQETSFLLPDAGLTR